MKNRIFLFLGIIGILSSPALAATYAIDSSSSKITWVGKKVTGQHNGTLKVKSGSISLSGAEIQSGSISIDMQKLAVDDIKDPETNKKLTVHLQSEDFFATDTFKEAQFNLKKIRKKESQMIAEGELTIKGITKPISFPIEYANEPKRVKIKGTAEVDRTLYDIRYKSGKFFPDLGDKLIYDTFTVNFDLVALKK